MAANGGGMGILTAIMVSGGVALLVLGRHKLQELNLVKPIPSKSSCSRSCLSSANNLRRKKKSKKVRFAAEVVEEQEQQQEQEQEQEQEQVVSENAVHPVEERKVSERRERERERESNIPANRLALYNGMLRYRMHQASLYR